MKKARVEKGISISELAREVELSERYISFLEAGKKNPSLKTALKISQALERRVDDLFLL